MPAIVLADRGAEYTLCRDMANLKHIRLVAVGDDGYTHDVGSEIVHIAWEGAPEASVTASGSVITLNSAAGATAGIIHVWTRDFTG